MTERGPSRTGSERTRERVLDAALELFGSKGFTGTTTKEIAKKAGVNEVTLFRTFRSKQALYACVFAERSLLPSILETVEFDSETPIDEMMLRNVSAVLAILKDNRHMFMVMLGDAWRQPRTRKMLGEGAMQRAVEFLASMLEQQMGEGRLKRVDPEVAARSIIGMVQAYFLTTYLLQGSHDDPARDERFMRGFVSIILDGLRPAKGGEGS